MTMTSEQLLENFKGQQTQVMEEIRKLDTELAQKRELFVKLQGAIEGLALLNPEESPSDPELAPTEVVE